MKKIIAVYILVYTGLVSLSQTKRDTLLRNRKTQRENVQKQMLTKSEELVRLLTQDLEELESDTFTSIDEKEKAIKKAQRDLVHAKLENRRLHKYCDSMNLVLKRMEDSIRHLDSRRPKK